MPDEKVKPSDIVKVVTILKLEDGTVIDAADLSIEQREAYIEFAIHLAAPEIAKLISRGLPAHGSSQIKDEQTSVNNAYFEYPAMMSVKEAAKMMNVSESMIREMERRWKGKFFPSIRIGSRIKIQRDELIQWLKEGGISKYREDIKIADEEYERSKARYPSYRQPRKKAPKMR